MKITIWGTGAVGLGLASALARPTSRLQLLVRSDATAISIQSQGIKRIGLFGDLEISPDQFELIREPRTLAVDPPDWLLICVKTFSTNEIAEELEAIAESLQPVTKLLLCQNGWDNEAAFLPFWPKDRLFHARIITGFHQRQPGLVEITAHAAPIALGSLFGGDLDVLEPLVDRLSEGGLPAETTQEMGAVLWAKMLYNCALNPLGALADRRYGELTEDPTMKTLLEEVIREIFAVLAAARIDLPWPTAADYLETFYSELIPLTADHESSMLQDLRAGNRTEIESLCGAVERLGVGYHVATPVTSSLANLVRAAERRGKGPPQQPRVAPK
ncbi:MAG: 2-dehydropantoate 2-reductase [Myxococcota bacterium]